MRQATTVHMIFSTDSWDLMWGERETVHSLESVAEIVVSLASFSMAVLLSAQPRRSVRPDLQNYG
jgi:hypothetical protein